MFDKLVESTSTGAELKPRRRIFAASFFLVAVLFAAAVVTSIYAADFDLGNDNFDIAQLLSPIAATEPPPEPEPEQSQPRNSNLPRSSNDQFVRPVLMASTDDFTRIPDKTSSEVNPYATIPLEKYANVRVGSVPADPGPGGGSGMSESGSGSGKREIGTEVAEVKPPPAPPKIEKKVTTISGGVMTGKAKLLPKPTYSAAAKSVGAQGAVTIQILVDETGKVISAKAVNGHPLLRPAAVEAALKARFDPTTLSGVPVKVTGIINYNFTR